MFNERWTTQELQQAAATNHTELFSLNSIALGGEVRHVQGLTWTWNPYENSGSIAFPVLSKENASESINEMMTYYRNRNAKNIGCWSLDPPSFPGLGVKM